MNHIITSRNQHDRKLNQSKIHIFLLLYQFLVSFAPIYALYALMLREVGMLSTNQITTIFSIWIFVVIVTELPTGIWTDKHSPKSAIIISGVLQTLCYFTWFVAPNYWGYICGFIIWGLSSAFGSGSLQSYIFSLTESSIISEYTKMFGSVQAIGFAALGLAYVYAGITAANYTGALIVSILSSISATLVIMLLPGPKKKAESRTTVQIMITAMNGIRNSHYALQSCIAMIFVGSLAISIIEISPLFYHDKGIATSLVPYLLAAGYFSSMVLSWFAHLFKTHAYISAVIIFCIAGFFTSLLSTVEVFYAVALIFIYLRLIRLSNLLLETDLQNHISSSTRASTHSIASLGAGILSIGIMAGYGFITIQKNSTIAMEYIGILSLFIGSMLLLSRLHVVKFKNKYRMRKSITQEHDYGCGIACFAFATGMTYAQAACYVGEKQANSTRFMVKDVTKVLNQYGLSYKSYYFREAVKDKLYQEGTIVLLRRSKLHPVGHYVIRYKDTWMDPWINLGETKDITEAKSGFHKILPGDPMYIICPIT